MDTETLDKIYLEYSQITKARTSRERHMLNTIKLLNSMILCGEQHSNSSEQEVEKIINDY